MAKRKKKTNVVRIAPTSWSNIVDMMLRSYPSMNEEGKKEVETEFRRMAKAADAYNSNT